MIFTALLVGTVAGSVNGVLIAYGRLVPFIATLAMMVAARGLAQKISGKLTQIVQGAHASTSLAEWRAARHPAAGHHLPGRRRGSAGCC